MEHLEAADFILAHGTEAIGLANNCGVKPMKLDELEKILEHAVEKRIPMIIANPDLVTVEARALRVMPGTINSNTFLLKTPVFQLVKSTFITNLKLDIILERHTPFNPTKKIYIF